jgi:hypothetical protein
LGQIFSGPTCPSNSALFITVAGFSRAPHRISLGHDFCNVKASIIVDEKGGAEVRMLCKNKRRFSRGNSSALGKAGGGWIAVALFGGGVVSRAEALEKAAEVLRSFDPEIADSRQQKEDKHRAPLHVRQCSESGCGILAPNQQSSPFPAPAPADFLSLRIRMPSLWL